MLRRAAANLAPLSCYAPLAADPPLVGIHIGRNEYVWVRDLIRRAERGKHEATQ